MKRLFKITWLLLMLAGFAVGANAQASINNTNMVTRLTDMGQCKIDDIDKYFAELKYAQTEKKDKPYDKYTETTYKYQLPGQNNDYYVFAAIDGQVINAGVCTDSKKDIDDAVKIAIDNGYAFSETYAKISKTVYTKRGYRLSVTEKTTDGKTSYLFTIQDNMRAAKITAGRY